VLAGGCLLAACAALAAGPVTHSSADLSGQINAKQGAASQLQSAIAAEDARIAATSGGLAAAQGRLNTIESQLAARMNQLIAVQNQLLAARDRLTAVENRLEDATGALRSNLVANFENGAPDVATVLVEAHGFDDLLDQLDYMRRIADHNGEVIQDAQATRALVAAQATQLGTLEIRDQSLTTAVEQQRDQAAALRAALLNTRLRELEQRNAKASVLGGLRSQLKSLQTRELKEFGMAAPQLGGIRVDVGGMVQPPPGAPAAVAQVIAAGNAIATLPYVWGGGHGSFHADGYDCSGSVSYALAAAGLLSSPLDSTGFESWGEPGPGRWITVYANAGHAFMYVAGWRFDTVALAEGGTRWSRTPADTSGFVARHPPGL
jgi:peptidoglycan hydrolase CwlO-like protein